MVSVFKDSVSMSSGNGDGFTFCGNRQYSFSPSDIVTVVSPTQWDLRVASPTYTAGVTITVYVTVTVEHSASASEVFSFSVNALCLPLTIQDQVGPTYEYIIGDPLGPLQIPIPVVDGCSLNCAIQTVEPNTWLSNSLDDSSGTTYDIQSSDVAGLATALGLSSFSTHVETDFEIIADPPCSESFKP